MEKTNFKEFPPKVRQGIMALIGAWVFLILSQAMFYGTVSLIQMTIGSFCCVLVYALRNWGRIISIVYNLVLIGNSGYAMYNYSQHQVTEPLPYGIQIVNILLFAAATYLLLHKETNTYFKEHRAKTTGEG